jgi:LPS-assembly lipoprotein
MKKLVVAVVAVASLTLSACGFTPLYSAQGPGGPAMRETFAAIYVDKVEGGDSRAGMHIRNYLLDALNPNGMPSAPEMRLKIRLRESRRGLAIQDDSSITRYNYQLVAEYQLVGADGKIIDLGVARALAAYNVVDSQYATLVGRQNAVERAAHDVGESIKLRLGLALRDPEASAAAAAANAAAAPAQ